PGAAAARASIAALLASPSDAVVNALADLLERPQDPARFVALAVATAATAPPATASAVDEVAFGVLAQWAFSATAPRSTSRGDLPGASAPTHLATGSDSAAAASAALRVRLREAASVLVEQGIEWLHEWMRAEDMRHSAAIAAAE